MTKILIFGSSETWGAFDKESGGWADRLKIHCFNLENIFAYEVYNFGIASDDTNGLLFRLENQVEMIEKIEPDNYIFIFSIGKNDARYVKEKSNKFVKIEKYSENIKKIIQATRKYSDRIYFVGYPHIDDSKTMPYDKETLEFYENDDLEEYDNKLQEICKSENVNYIYTRDLHTKEDFEDGVHPNTEGHRKIFERVKEELNKTLDINKG